MPAIPSFKKYYFLLLAMLWVGSTNSYAQTCKGSLGDPIVNITFGAGSNFGAPLSAGTTSSLQYKASTCPPDGYYSIVNYTSGCWPNDVVWHSAKDHTNNKDGYYMLINASNQPSNFYIQTISGLCEGTAYQFAAWLLNMCSVKGISPNITFTIEKLDGSVLGTYNTGDIPIINPVTWAQYGFYFTTPAGVNTVVLRMRNNSPGGVGNDLGLDDITFRPAGPKVEVKITGGVNDVINICSDDKTTLNFQSLVENCFVNTAYQWQLSTDNGNSWANIAGANSAGYPRVPTGTGQFLYRLNVAETINIGVKTCSVSSNPITVIVNANPITSIANSGEKCSGDMVTLIANGGDSYQWNGPNGFVSSSNKAILNDLNFNHAGKYFVTVTNNVGCAAIDSTLVNVYAKPLAMFDIPSPMCENHSIKFFDQSVNYGQPLVKWNWNFGDASSTSTSSLSAPLHVYTKGATYKVSLFVENDMGCKSAFLIKDIAVNFLPKPAFGMPNICLSDPYALFTDSSLIDDNSMAQFSYLWNFGDANVSTNNSNSSNAKNPQHAYTSIGQYPVSLQVTSKDGCVKDTLRNFIVNGATPVAKFGVDASITFCSNDSIRIIDSSSVNFGKIVRIEIYWDYQNNPNLKTVDSFPAVNKKYAFKFAPFAPLASKKFQLRYVVYSGISCVNEVSKFVTINASPIVSFNNIGNVCQNVPAFLFSQGTEINGMAGIGTYNGAGVNVTGYFNPAIAVVGDHIIRYTFLANNNCSSFKEQTIKILLPPTADAGADKFILSGGFTTLKATATGNSLQYVWTPNTYITNNTILKPIVSPILNTRYNLSVISADGCVATDDVLVSVLKDIYVPTAFSPNGDGLNDTWRIPFTDSYDEAAMKVYNRYGQIVYQSTSTAIEWDGTYKGQLLSTGSYAWVFNPGNGKKIMHGLVTIVK